MLQTKVRTWELKSPSIMVVGNLKSPFIRVWQYFVFRLKTGRFKLLKPADCSLITSQLQPQNGPILAVKTGQFKLL